MNLDGWKIEFAGNGHIVNSRCLVQCFPGKPLGYQGTGCNRRTAAVCFKPCFLNDTRFADFDLQAYDVRSEEHTSELQSLMRISYAVFCLKKTKYTTTQYIYK